MTDNLPKDDSAVEDAKTSKAKARKLKSEHSKMMWTLNPKRRATKLAVITLAVGLVVGFVGCLALQAYLTRQANETNDISVVFERVLLQDELVTASQDYQVIDKFTSQNYIAGFAVPLSTTDLWYKYVGTIKVAVDLEKARLISSNENVIKLQLEEPYISSNTPDLDNSGTIGNYESILNPTKPEDVDKAQQAIASRLEEEALKGDIFEEAKENAAADLSRLFSVALNSDYKVEIEWTSSSEQQ